ncbi:hypothetical protein IQ37_19435 [Chryseobacterium piperi]|uniref:Sugar-binding protein n=1 Tax=Chryseobacterium piperi TaxID=558152 RepID=A0A086A5M3_9FLAO|nr:hypothetical protein [Chryseobacterium piperi]KFF11987.1 hypothetical protein IQ37_19435 [Chryseobacterium piperi]
MNKYLLFFFVFLQYLVSGQGANPEISNELPKIIPPSPSVSSLMRFEEIPVNNYTGIPDISIPLFNTPLSTNLNIDIGLKYHAAGVNSTQISSDVGVGWSLFAGGSISRVVRGLPDELKILPTGNNTSPTSTPFGKIGIYHNDISNDRNNYYYFVENILNNTKDYYKPQLSQQEQNIGNEFLWNTTVKGKYDTEHDLWQFNFMGFSGRFYIKKIGNQLIIQPLDEYRIRIENQYNNNFEPIGFIIYDEYGYKYTFNEIETTRNFGAIQSMTINNDGNYITSDKMYSDRLFRSAFHISEVFDQNNNLLVLFKYNQNPEFKEGFRNSTIIKNSFAESDIAMYHKQYNGCLDLPALESRNMSSVLVNVKKLEEIQITNKSKIIFNFLQGRSDTNLTTPNNSVYLKSITVKDWNDHFVNKYEFENSYQYTLDRRMFLAKINIYNNDNQIEQNYQFDYFNKNISGNIGGNGKVIGRDKWGYFNLLDQCELTTERHKEATPEFSTHELLQKIKYPTGGTAVFDFESNKYSFIGNQEITNLPVNSDTYTFVDSILYSLNNNNPIKAIPVSNTDRMVKFYPSLYHDPGNSTRTFILQKKVNGAWVQVENLICTEQNQQCCISVKLDKLVEYAIRRHNFDVTYKDNDDISFTIYNIEKKKYLHGGGNRIKKISYYDKNIQNLPSKERVYNYEWLNDPNKSSGSLVFFTPTFDYNDTFATELSQGAYNSYCNSPFTNTLHGYLSESSANYLISLKTHGADVGYKSVSVSETGNGKIQYEYTSPLDFPENDVQLGPPFMPSHNYDYKRGLLLKQKIFDNNNRLLSELTNQYSYVESLIHTGLRFRRPYGSCYTGPVAYNDGFYEAYKNFVTSPPQEVCVPCNGLSTDFSTKKGFLCGLPLDLNSPKILVFPIFEAFGWSKLGSKISKNYFYENGSQKTLEKKELFEYNNINKKVLQHSTTIEDGTELNSRYFYHSGNSVYSKNRISEIEKIENYRNGKLLNTKKINYKKDWPGNGAYLPSQIQTSLGTLSLENEVTYDRYDSKGNIQQYTTKAGVSTTIIWGYNQTQPIAKIEGAKLADITPSLITTIVNASNTDAANPAQEPALITALDNFRKNSGLSNYQITTYTYDPLKKWSKNSSTIIKTNP